MPRKKIEVAPSAPEQESNSEQAPAFVTRSVRVDKFNTRRFLVEVRPSTCDICGHDMCVANKLPPFEKLNEKLQAQVAVLLEEHRQRLHTAKELRDAEERAAVRGKSLSEEAKES